MLLLDTVAAAAGPIAHDEASGETMTPPPPLELVVEEASSISDSEVGYSLAASGAGCASIFVVSIIIYYLISALLLLLVLAAPAARLLIAWSWPLFCRSNIMYFVELRSTRGRRTSTRED